MDFGEILQELWEKIYGWGEALVLLLPNMAVALLITIGFIIFANLSRNIVGRVLGQFTQNTVVKRLGVNITRLIIISIGVFIALGILNLEKTVTSLLAGAGIIGLALGFAFQDISSNFISGVMIAFRRPFKVGDLVETNDYFGRIKEITLRTVILSTPQGQEVIVPNRQVFQSSLIQYSTGFRRVDLEVGVSYGDNLEKVQKLAVEAISNLDFLASGKEVKLFYKEFGGSSINFVLQYWIPYQENSQYLHAKSEGIKAIKLAFDQNDISIPFPIRTLDFGIKGGKSLGKVVGMQEIVNQLPN